MAEAFEGGLKIATIFIEINQLRIALSTPFAEKYDRFCERWASWIVPRPSKRSISILITAQSTEKGIRKAYREAYLNPPRGYDVLFPTAGSLTKIKIKPHQLRADILFERRLLDTHALHFAVLEVVLQNFMRRLNFFPLHAASVVQGGRSVLILGESGAGKSTTAALFLLAGFQPLSDDYPIGCLRNGDAMVLGREKGVLICHSGMRYYEVFSQLKDLGQKRPWDPHKRLLCPADPCSSGSENHSGNIKMVLFPEVKSGARSRFERLGREEALVSLLAQKPIGLSEYLNDQKAINLLFQFYDTVSRRASCYKLILGKDRGKIPALIQKLIKREGTWDETQKK